MIREAEAMRSQRQRDEQEAAARRQAQQAEDAAALETVRTEARQEAAERAAENAAEDLHEQDEDQALAVRAAVAVSLTGPLLELREHVLSTHRLIVYLAMSGPDVESEAEHFGKVYVPLLTTAAAASGIQLVVRAPHWAGRYAAAFGGREVETRLSECDGCDVFLALLGTQAPDVCTPSAFAQVDEKAARLFTLF
jgi:multidrug efflux pump subunit AcrA (membrane-fusion protein)